MTLEILLDEFPKDLVLKDGLECSVRPMESQDEEALRGFLLTVPERERMFIKHRIDDPALVRGWCENIDYGRNLPLLAFGPNGVLADATLHQQLGGWKRHIGRISVLVHPEYRGRGLARALVAELTDFARQIGLSKLEAEFIGEQEAAIKVFALLGYSKLVHLPKYVRDMEAVSHDYILMGCDLKTPEEYAGMG